MRKKECYLVSEQELRDLLDGFGYQNLVISFDFDGLVLENDDTGEYLSEDDINKIFSECLGKKVSSVHIDDCELPGIWIVPEAPKKKKYRILKCSDEMRIEKIIEEWELHDDDGQVIFEGNEEETKAKFKEMENEFYVSIFSTAVTFIRFEWLELEAYDEENDVFVLEDNNIDSKKIKKVLNDFWHTEVEK